MELTFRIEKNIEVVFDYLSDMQKYVLIHPVITQIDDLGNNKYLVHETLKLGFIPFSFTYFVTVEKYVINKVIIYRSTVFGLTKINMTFELIDENEYTIIKENIQFKSPLPIIYFMGKIFKKQHRRLFKNLELQ